MPKRTGRYWREHVVPAVLKRDGGICFICGQPGATTADHLKPAINLPESQWYDLSNLVAAHARCNRVKSDRSLTYARDRVAAETPRDIGWKW